MQSFVGYSIRNATAQVPSDAELESVLRQVYVGEGFTSQEHATDSLSAQAVRARGELLVAVKDDVDEVVGVVMLVPPGSPAQQIASEETEAEIHLLAVLPKFRRKGLGRMLVSQVMERARACGYESLILWTQPSMQTAHRLYTDVGFKRLPARDFEKRGREFLVPLARGGSQVLRPPLQGSARYSMATGKRFTIKTSACCSAPFTERC